MLAFMEVVETWYKFPEFPAIRPVRELIIGALVNVRTVEVALLGNG